MDTITTTEAHAHTHSFNSITAKLEAIELCYCELEQDADVKGGGKKTLHHDQVIQIVWILVAASDVLQLATFAPETQQKTLLLQAAL
jgi:hypothetical protein